MTTRKARVTEEHLQEAARLRAIWDATPDKPSQQVFGERFEIGNQSAVGQFLRGAVPLSMKAAVGFAKGLQCNLADISPRLALEIVEGSRLISGEPIAHNKEFGGRGGSIVGIQVVGDASIQGDQLHIEYMDDGGYVVGSGIQDGYALRVRGDGGNPAIKDGQYLVVEREGNPVFSDYCIVETEDGRTLLAEFLAERADSYAFETVGGSTRLTLSKDDVKELDGVIAVVSSRRWRPPPKNGLFGSSRATAVKK
jgi:hypothetical protein